MASSSTTYTVPLSRDDTPTLWLSDHGMLAETIHQAMQQRYSASEKLANDRVPIKTPRRSRKKRAMSRRLKERLERLQSRPSLGATETLREPLREPRNAALDDEEGDFSDADSIDLSRERLSHKEREWEQTFHAMEITLARTSLQTAAPSSPPMCQTRSHAMAA